MTDQTKGSSDDIRSIMPYLRSLGKQRDIAESLIRDGVRGLFKAPEFAYAAGSKARTGDLIERALRRHVKHVAWRYGMADLTDHEDSSDRPYWVPPAPEPDLVTQLFSSKESIPSIFLGAVSLRVLLADGKEYQPAATWYCFYRIIRELFEYTGPDWAIGGARSTELVYGATRPSTFVTAECSRALIYMAEQLSRTAKFFRSVDGILRRYYLARQATAPGAFAALPIEWWQAESARRTEHMLSTMFGVLHKIAFPLKRVEKIASERDKWTVGTIAQGLIADLLQWAQKCSRESNEASGMIRRFREAEKATDLPEMSRYDELLAMEKAPEAPTGGSGEFNQWRWHVIHDARKHMPNDGDFLRKFLEDVGLRFARSEHGHAKAADAIAAVDTFFEKMIGLAKDCVTTLENLEASIASANTEDEINNLGVSLEKMAMLCERAENDIRRSVRPSAAYLRGQMYEMVYQCRLSGAVADIPSLVFAASAYGHITNDWGLPILSEIVRLVEDRIDESGRIPAGTPFHVSSHGYELVPANAQVIRAFANLAARVPIDLNVDAVARMLRWFDRTKRDLRLGQCGWGRGRVSSDERVSAWLTEVTVLALNRTVVMLSAAINRAVARCLPYLHSWQLAKEPLLEELLPTDYGVHLWGAGKIGVQKPVSMVLERFRQHLTRISHQL